MNLQMFATATGIVGTDDYVSTRVRVEMADEIVELEPEAAPLTVLLKKLRKKTTNNHKFQWHEGERPPETDAINNGAGYADSDTSLVVDNGSYFTVGDVVKVPRTGECMLVTAISNNTLTVVRGFGETSAAALVDNDPLYIIGNANEEGATSRDINTRTETLQYNFTQIFRTPIGVTGTAAAERYYGPDERANQRAYRGIQHLVEIEKSFLFGERYEDTSGTHPRRTTRGVLAWLSTNVTDAGGALTETEFDEWLEGVFRYSAPDGSSTKILLASARLVSIINAWGKDKLETVPRDQVYGLRLLRYRSPHGELLITKHHLLKDATYGYYGIALDLANLYYRPLRGRDTHLNTEIQANNEDAVVDEWFTEAGLELRLEKTHGYIYNVDAA